MKSEELDEILKNIEMIRDVCYDIEAEACEIFDMYQYEFPEYEKEILDYVANINDVLFGDE